nr:glutaminyl-peptide cyclotransferase [Pelagibacterales bacterium]
TKLFINNKVVHNEIILNNYILGNQKVKAIIYSGSESYTLNSSFDIYSNVIPTLYKYEIINEFKHDDKAYTQGLEFYEGVLYESTGLNGKSSLRKVNYRTGEVLKSIKIDNEYFAEGITVLNDKIYQLTWKNQIGFIYNTNLEYINTFKYGNSIQGWGLCNDGEYIYKSDGTNKIWLLDKDTLEEIRNIEVMTNKSKIKNINELEYINGKIYANTYQLNRDVVIIINPSNGAVEGVIDFTGIRDLVKKTPDLDVMNGIAYNPITNKIYVTGKNWNKLFEIKLVNN